MLELRRFRRSGHALLSGGSENVRRGTVNSVGEEALSKSSGKQWGHEDGAASSPAISGRGTLARLAANQIGERGLSGAR